MRLSVSNIGWEAKNDSYVYSIMKSYKFAGLEIAPTRIFPDNPYDHITEARNWADELKKHEGLSIPSMQSIWYGRSEKLFGSREERSALVEYTKKAILFAQAIGCKNLVFGCPRNRTKPKKADENIAIEFFREIGDYAFAHNTVVGMEANPPMYNTNFIIDTASALKIIETVDSDGFKLNLDVGTMIANEEDLSVLQNKEQLINHVHISEPGLKILEKRSFHKDLIDVLINCGYDGFISIEVAGPQTIDNLECMMRYIRSLIGDN